MRRAGGASPPDPFVVPDGNTIYAPGANKNAAGLTLRSPRLNAGENTAVFVIAGQSNCANSVDTAYTPTNSSKVDNFNIYDGGVYAAADPLLGCTISTTGNKGNVFGRVADKLINAGTYDRVILAPVGFGGTGIADWRTGGALNQRLLIVAQRLAAVGLPITAFLWMQGENDKELGTSQATYTAALAEVIGTPRAAGFDAPWLIGQCTYIFGATSSTVRAAQAAAVNGVDIFAGADTDTLTGTSVNRQADDAHFKAAGADAAATLWKTAIEAAL